MWAVKTKCWRRRMFLFPLSPPCEHPVDLLLGLLLLPPLLYYPNSGAQWEYPVVRCELAGNNKQWVPTGAQVGPYGYLTPAFYYNPSSSTTSVFVFTLLLTYNGSTTRPKQRSGALSFGTGCSFTRATNHFTTLIWSLTIFPVIICFCAIEAFSFPLLEQQRYCLNTDWAAATDELQ